MSASEFKFTQEYKFAAVKQGQDFIFLENAIKELEKLGYKPEDVIVGLDGRLQSAKFIWIPKNG